MPDTTDTPANTTDPAAGTTDDAPGQVLVVLSEIGACLAALDGIGKLNGASGHLTGWDKYDGHLLALANVYGPALLAAVSKVLEIHVRQKAPRRRWDWVCDKHRAESFPLYAMVSCAECKYRDVWFCEYRHCREAWPCTTYGAIAAELLGQDQQRGEEPS